MGVCVCAYVMVHMCMHVCSCMLVHMKLKSATFLVVVQVLKFAFLKQNNPAWENSQLDQ